MNLSVVGAAVQEDPRSCDATIVDFVVVDLDVVAALGGDDAYRSERRGYKIILLRTKIAATSNRVDVSIGKRAMNSSSAHQVFRKPKYSHE